MPCEFTFAGVIESVIGVGGVDPKKNAIAYNFQVLSQDDQDTNKVLDHLTTTIDDKLDGLIESTTSVLSYTQSIVDKVDAVTDMESSIQTTVLSVSDGVVTLSSDVKDLAEDVTTTHSIIDNVSTILNGVRDVVSNTYDSLSNVWGSSLVNSIGQEVDIMYHDPYDDTEKEITATITGYTRAGDDSLITVRIDNSDYDYFQFSPGSFLSAVYAILVSESRDDRIPCVVSVGVDSA